MEHKPTYWVHAAYTCRKFITGSSIFTTEIMDCCDLTYDDQSFDIAHSNSVVEHLIDWDRMRAFASHARRVGLAYFMQTPSFWFPVEPHFGLPFFHWMPEPVRISMVLRRALATYPKADGVNQATEFVHGARLLDFRQFSSLFPDGTITREKIAGLTKSYVAVRAAVRRPLQ